MSAELAKTAKPAGEKPKTPGSALSWFGRASAALALAMLALLAFWNLLWKQAGAQLAIDPRYTLTAESIDLPDPPEWIHHDLRPEILAYLGETRRVSILDDDLTERLHRAAAAHPWIAAVREVRKAFPARVQIACEYRKPAAMVRVPEGLLPVDADGVLLPTRDFTPQEAARYPRIEGIETPPRDVAGRPWADPRVEAAAKLAEMLSPYWTQLQFARIVPLQLQPSSGTPISLEVLTRGGSRVIWGSPPNVSPDDEAPPEVKMRRLDIYFKEHGSLEGLNGPQLFDLRSAAGVRISPIANNEQQSLP
ncbi:MAG: cell division protein FtsQ/DivIB [Thermogutta sp.]